MGYGGAAVGNVVGSTLGSLFGGDDAQRRALRDALAELQSVNAEAGPSAFEDLYADPAMRTAQVAALRRLQDESAEGGMGLQSRVALNEAAGDVARRERGGREAILQQMAMRGNRGGGAELAANLMNQQGSADRNAAFGARAAADARARALQAAAQSGQMAGGIRGQDWGEGSDRASAQDALSRFNASQRLTRAGMLSNVRMGGMGQAKDEDERRRGLFSGLGQAAGYGLPF